MLFRLFDVWKPWPICWADKKVKGGLGIMLDDVFAAIFYWLCAIERVEENTLVIASIAEPHLEVLQELSSKDMLELAMI